MESLGSPLFLIANSASRSGNLSRIKTLRDKLQSNGRAPSYLVFEKNFEFSDPAAKGSVYRAIDEFFTKTFDSIDRAKDSAVPR